MKQMKRSYIFVAALTVAGLVGLQTAQASIIVASDITDGSSSYTTADTLVTLTPYAQGLTAGTLGANASFFGVTGGGNNQNIIDGDGDPSTPADREALDITLDATVGFSQFTFNWSRADGPDADDGIVISGFTADPGATYTGTGTPSISYVAAENSLYVSIYSWGIASQVDFSNLAASAGQTLRMSVNDSTQAAPVVALSSISYDVIPEPATLGLLVAMGGGILFIRRRFMI